MIVIPKLIRKRIKNMKNKYLNKYHSLEYQELAPELLQGFKKVFIEDETPRGVVRMNYNVDVNAFTYYSDSKDIPYSYLETLGRIFVIKNNCKCVFIDYEKEKKDEEEKKKNEEEAEKRNEEEKKQNEEEAEKEKKTDDKEDKEDKEMNVFATLKRYQIIDKKKETPLLIKTNHYIYKGKLREYKEMEFNKPINDEFEHIDYNTFKNMNINEKKNL